MAKVKKPMTARMRLKGKQELRRPVKMVSRKTTNAKWRSEMDD